MEPTPDQMLVALQESGYLFEQEVADRLEALGFHVDTGWAYLDADESKSRELDVRGIQRVFHDEQTGLSVFIELLVECKAQSSPFVFLQRPKNERERKDAKAREYVFPRRHYKTPVEPRGSYRETPPFVHLQLAQHHYYYREDTKATQFSKIVRKRQGGPWVANHDGIYDSIILPLAKALEFERAKESARVADSKTVWLMFPIVVLRSSLYAMDVTRPNAKPEPKARVSFVRHLESGNVKGFYLTDFVLFDWLNEYITREVRPFADHVGDLCRSQPALILPAERPR